MFNRNLSNSLGSWNHPLRRPGPTGWVQIHPGSSTFASIVSAKTWPNSNMAPRLAFTARRTSWGVKIVVSGRVERLMERKIRCNMV